MKGPDPDTPFFAGAAPKVAAHRHVLIAEPSGGFPPRVSSAMAKQSIVFRRPSARCDSDAFAAIGQRNSSAMMCLGLDRSQGRCPCRGLAAAKTARRACKRAVLGRIYVAMTRRWPHLLRQASKAGSMKHTCYQRRVWHQYDACAEGSSQRHLRVPLPLMPDSARAFLQEVPCHGHYRSLLGLR